MDLYVSPVRGGEVLVLEQHEIAVQLVRLRDLVVGNRLVLLLAVLPVADRRAVGDVDEVQLDVVLVHRRVHADGRVDEPEGDVPAPDRSCHERGVPDSRSCETVAGFEAAAPGTGTRPVSNETKETHDTDDDTQGALRARAQGHLLRGAHDLADASDPRARGDEQPAHEGVRAPPEGDEGPHREPRAGLRGARQARRRASSAPGIEGIKREHDVFMREESPAERRFATCS